MAILSNDVLPSEVVRHGAYVCLMFMEETRVGMRAARVKQLVKDLRLENEYDAGGHPANAVSFLSRASATGRDIPDNPLLRADAVIHVASDDEQVVNSFCRELQRLLSAATAPRILRGGVRPAGYTGAAMHNFAYAHQVTQQPGSAMANAFLVPMSKTRTWWEKSWLERHTYLLPRYDEDGRMTHEGHALAASAGIPCLMRRTYKSYDLPAGEGDYDFLNYFECADKDIPTFHAVCAALRDVERNPEWKFVKEGPTWQGRRVREWQELFKIAPSP